MREEVWKHICSGVTALSEGTRMMKEAGTKSPSGCLFKHFSGSEMLLCCMYYKHYL